MKPEDYRKVVKFCDKARENSFGVCWCGKLHSDAAEKLKPEEQIIVRNESNSCLVTELFANFQTSIDRKSIIGETHSVEEMEKLMLEFAKFNIKPSDVLGKTVIFECKSISAYE